jgi:biopolymer transport protein ExbD
MAVKIEKGSALSNLSLTPLIDIVFLLLIFFLVATRFAEEEQEMSVQLPEASEAQPLTSKPRELFINIDAEGRYYVTGKIIALRELESVLNQSRVNNPGKITVVIRADKRVTWQYVVSAMNACNKAKIRDYKVTTQKNT